MPNTRAQSPLGFVPSYWPKRPFQGLFGQLTWAKREAFGLSFGPGTMDPTVLRTWEWHPEILEDISLFELWIGLKACLALKNKRSEVLSEEGLKKAWPPARGLLKDRPINGSKSRSKSFGDEYGSA